MFCFPDSSVGKESASNAEDPGSIPGSGRSPGEGLGYPLQYSWASLVAQLVKNPPAMWVDLGSIPGLGRSPWRRERVPTPIFWPGEFHGLYIVYGVSKRLSDFHFLRSKGIKHFNMRMSVGGNMKRWAGMPNPREGGEADGILGALQPTRGPARPSEESPRSRPAFSTLLL